MDYYILDSITCEYPNTYWGEKNGKRFECFNLSVDDTEEDLKERGFVKVDAPNFDCTLITEAGNLDDF